MNTQTAKLNYLKIAPRKVRLIAGTLKGLSVQEAEAQLLLRIQRSAKPLLKLLRSAIANAKNKKLDPAKLYISSVLVNPGPRLKRLMPRAQGRGMQIHKKMSHVVLTLSESEAGFRNRFVINPPTKKSAAPKKEKIKPKAEETKKEAAAKKPGFFKRLFRRKSI